MRKFKVLFVPGLVVVVSLALFAQEPQGRGGQGAPAATPPRGVPPAPTVQEAARVPPLAQPVAREVAEEVVVEGERGGGGGGENLQVLQAGNLPETMQSFVQALGLLDKGTCAYCHVEDRKSDEKRPKVVARRMITMMRAINGTFPDGQQHVTCYTCHRGNTKPLMEPAF